MQRERKKHMDIIQIIILLTITISGTVFGSFFTLAVHRIPKKQDITHERSYCPNCNHKLQFLDLIPVWSYLFLRGKCRYCQQKIRPRYLLLEIASGLVFLLFAISYDLQVSLSLVAWGHFATLVLFLCCVMIVAGIDRESYQIPNGVLLYGAGIGLIHAGLLAYANTSLLPYVIGAVVIPIFLFLVNVICRKILKCEEPIGGGDIKYLAVLGLFMGFGAQLLTIVISLVFIFIEQFVALLTKQEKKEIAWGFFLSIGAVLVLIALPHIGTTIQLLDAMIL